ncbi:hypothetical protein Hypma_008056 [Hypsizygus marmoreus]|uniref:Chitin-binding type-3 domain-containing protein n=1 Tax=Hypsizygus marmoreus TaxID=39966 RepID=A0A369K319_HYPMA|nr:hypothetical protein Hypma_008056 [Hypsizygus marmoreus]
MSLSTHTTPLIISNPFDLPLNMTRYWEPGTQYNHGDVVEYDGHRYKIIQPHFSQSDWTPPVTPALWGRLQDADHGHNENQHHGQYNQQQPIQQQPPTYQQPHDQGQLQQGYPSSDQKVEPAQEEKKHWYDDDKLKVGAGLVAGAALLGGGLFAYKEHEEEKKNIQGWLRLLKPPSRTARKGASSYKPGRCYICKILSYLIKPNIRPNIIQINKTGPQTRG